MAITTEAITGIHKVTTTITADKHMKCQFNIPLPISASVGALNELIAKVSKAIADNGGDFTAADNGGLFSIPTGLGPVEGSFVYVDGGVSVSITDKPWLVSCARIQDELNQYLQSQPTAS